VAAEAEARGPAIGEGAGKTAAPVEGGWLVAAEARVAGPPAREKAAMEAGA